MIKKISKFIYQLTGILISVSLAAIVVLTFVQVVSRYVFSFPIDWAQELVVYIMVWLVFLGCSMGMRDNEVASLTFVIEKCKPITQRILKITGNVFIIVFSVVSAYYNQEVIRFSMMRRSPILGLQMGYVSLAFTVFCLIVTLNCCINIYDLISSFFKLPAGED